MNKSLELAKRNSSGKEQYYTRPHITEMCVELASKYIDDHIVVEPSAGTGEFLKPLMERKITYQAYDIEPKHPDVIEQDYLKFTPKPGKYFVIGNPPFGRNHSLSSKFFNKSAEYAEYIAFIIPKSWRKWSIQNRLDLNFSIIEDIELPSDIFYNHEGEGFGDNFNAVFQIWKRTEKPRKKVRIEDKSLVVKCDPQEVDVAITYAGYSAGKVEVDFPRVKNTTKIYLKANKKVVKALQELDYSKLTENSAYTPSFGLEEIKAELNKLF